MGKEVIILAGGLGTRLRSVVSDVPKCMAPVAGKPFLWYLLKYLSNFDVERVVLSVGYLRDTIIDWVLILIWQSVINGKADVKGSVAVYTIIRSLGFLIGVDRTF